MKTIELKSAPELKRLICAADSSYRKAKCYLNVRETVSLSNTYWDGGSRSTYTAVRLSDMRSIGAPQYAPSQFGGPVNPSVEIPAGIAIVETGVFCGKTATASISINPIDATVFLAA